MSDTPQPNIYQQFAATLARSQWGSRAELDIYRKGLLKRLVLFASEQSPFYRERLKPLFRTMRARYQPYAPQAAPESP
jgi:phenylacetate-coenzyme A ligase PaaK-like adenylate-forming protein